MESAVYELRQIREIFVHAEFGLLIVTVELAWIILLLMSKSK